MNQQDREIMEELIQKVESYEELLGKVLGEPKLLAVISAGPEDGLYRCTDEAGHAKFLLADPNKDTSIFKIGTKVLITEKIIVTVLPEELEIKEKLPEFKSLNWNEIGGMKSQIEEIRTAVESPLENEEVYKEMGVDPMKGLLLYGPPGCGKTLIAKAIASRILKELGEKRQVDSFVYIKGAELLSMYVGQTEAHIKKIFDNARLHYKKTGVKAVIFIDEAEAILNERGSRFSSDVDTTIVPTFLSEMDGFEGGNPFIILATNKPENLDSAVIRDGRIDLKIEIKRPTAEDAIDIFKIHLSKAKTIGDVNELSHRAAQLLFENHDPKTVSGAMIATMIQKAGSLAIKRVVKDPKTEKGITFNDLNSIIQTKIVENESVV